MSILNDFGESPLHSVYMVTHRRLLRGCYATLNVQCAIPITVIDVSPRCLREAQDAWVAVVSSAVRCQDTDAQSDYSLTGLIQHRRILKGANWNWHHLRVRLTGQGQEACVDRLNRRSTLDRCLTDFTWVT